ncbi:MAG TPA: hypothetical protein VFU47_14950 [Armatimonadota bacterium]|nr:hypothetical protein [Armatimonadota bacterium]
MTAKLAIPPGHRISGEDEGGNVKASVKSDGTIRTIRLDVEGVGDLDVTRSWQKKARVIRPDGALIKVVDGVRERISVYGPLVLKSGKTSDSVRDHWEWTLGRYTAKENHIDHAPEWVRMLWTEAVNGVTSWRTPDVTDPAEVQAL